MTRVLVLGATVAVGGGLLVGTTLAYGLTLYAILAIVLALTGAAAVAFLTPDEDLEPAPVILTGPLARPVADDEEQAMAEEPAAPEVVAEPVKLPVPKPSATPAAA